MNKKAVQDALEGVPANPPPPKEKLEEEVTVDLNTTKTNQERNYKEFIRNEVVHEATFFMDLFLHHEIRMAVSSALYLLPGIEKPMQAAIIAYFAIALCHLLLQGIHKKLKKGVSPSIRAILRGFELACVLMLLAIPSDPVVKLVIPCYLLFAMFGIMTSCLEFSDTLDELFTLKLSTIAPNLIFIVQFILLQLKSASIIEWKWFTVLSLSMVALLFGTIIGLVLLMYFLGLVIKAIRKKQTWLRCNQL